MTKVGGYTKEQWVKALTAHTTEKLWGYEYEFSPVICDEKIGDGNKLIWIEPIDTRPYYWLLLIGSNNNLEVDYIVQAVEQEFGHHPYRNNLDIQSKEDFEEYIKECELSGDEPKYDTYEEYEESCEYPNFYWEGGSIGSIVDFKTGYYNRIWFRYVEEYFLNLKSETK